MALRWLLLTLAATEPTELVPRILENVSSNLTRERSPQTQEEVATTTITLSATAAVATIATNGSSSSTTTTTTIRPPGRRLSAAALRVLCHLGDAEVADDNFNCSEVTVPMDYLQVCGRWQCRDPKVDHCVFSSGSWEQAEPPEPAEPAEPPEPAEPGAGNASQVSLALRRLRRAPAPASFAPEIEVEGSEPEVKHATRCANCCRRSDPFFLCDSEDAAIKPAGLVPVEVKNASHCASCCRRSDPFFQCDSDNAANLSKIWGAFGHLVSKLNSGDPKPRGREGDADSKNASGWNFCAEEGQLCLCLGEVRFGLETAWAAETLWAKNGLVFCSADTFSTAEKSPPRRCECRGAEGDEGGGGPLVVPSRGSRLASNVSSRRPVEEGRFIRSQPYSDDFLNGVRYDYASMHAGARLVTHAKGLLHAKSVLSPDKSLYMLSPCQTRTWFVISLLEDIFVEHVGLITLELFASGYRHLQILGSNQYPTETWRLLGEIESNFSSNYEIFDVGSRCQRLAEECWVGFLKIRVLSHHRMEDNSFCALTRFQVFGATATNYVAKERTAEDQRDRRVEPSLVDIAKWHEDMTRLESREESVRKPKLEPEKEKEKTEKHREEGKSLMDLPWKGVTWVTGKMLQVLHPQVAAPENVSEENLTEPKVILSDMLHELNVSSQLESTAGGSLASLEKLQAALDSLASASEQRGGKRPDASMPALVAINKELREMQQSQEVLKEHTKHVISCLNTMLALVVQLFNEQNARMKRLEASAVDRYSNPGIAIPGNFSQAVGRPEMQLPPLEERFMGEIPGPGNFSEVERPRRTDVLFQGGLDRLLLIFLVVHQVCRGCFQRQPPPAPAEAQAPEALGEDASVKEDGGLSRVEERRFKLPRAAASARFERSASRRRTVPRGHSSSSSALETFKLEKAAERPGERAERALVSSGEERGARKELDLGSASPFGNSDSHSSSEREEALHSSVAALPRLKVPKRKPMKRYSSAARRHPVHQARRETGNTNSPLAGPTESQ